MLRNILQFIGNPSASPSEEMFTKQRIRRLMVIFVICFLGNLLFGLVARGIVWTITGQFPKSHISDFFNSTNPWIVLFLAGLLAPLFEEIIFRLSLKFSPIYLSLSLTFLAYYVLSTYIYETGNYNVSDDFLNRILCSLTMGILSFMITRRYSEVLQRFWNNHFRWIFYVSCLLFAWMHITNFDINIQNMLLMPILTLPQLWAGICFGYTRMRLGFVYNVALHSMLNISIICPVLLSK